MTPEQVKQEFARQGISFANWAKEHGFPYGTVIAVINGVNKGRRGEAHKVAVALGIKQAA